jgi:hypothetical protein
VANRYWVGGTDNWDGTAGTKWAATSGGVGGETVPTIADDVFLDANSGANTVSIPTVNVTAKSLNCTGFTGTFSKDQGLTLAGSLTLVPAMTWLNTSIVEIYFTGTGTITTAGKSLPPIFIDGVGITVTLGDALATPGRAVTITQGTFDTANYSVTASAIISTNFNTRTIILGSSTLTLSANQAVDFLTPDNLTLSAGTSQINCSSASAQIRGGDRTFYNVSYTSTVAGTRLISTGANTFNNLTLTASDTGLSQLSVAANQTINGTFTCAGSSATARGFLRSETIGTSRTITAAVISANDCDFRDITIAGAASPISPTRAGNCGGNTNITFPAAKTVYRVSSGSAWTSPSGWATSSGGTGSSGNFPLAQDTAVINNDTTLTGTLYINSLGTEFFNLPAIDMSQRTTGLTFNVNQASIIYGSIIFGSGITVAGGNTLTFSGRGTMDFTSAGKTITFPITVDTPGGTFRLGDAFSSSTSILLTRGTFNANNYNVTLASFSTSNSNTRALAMGSGLWTITSGGTIWNISTATNLTFNKGTADILLTTGSAVSFASGPLIYNKLTIGGGASVQTATINSTIGSSAGSYSELASTRTAAFNLQLGNSSTAVIGTWSVSGTPGNVVTVNSPTAGTRRTFTLTNVTSGIDYLSVRDVGELSGGKFYVGPNSTNVSNNSNVFFTNPPTTTDTGNMFMLF